MTSDMLTKLSDYTEHRNAEALQRYRSAKRRGDHDQPFLKIYRDQH
jgi:hypothetical protein